MCVCVHMCVYILCVYINRHQIYIYIRFTYNIYTYLYMYMLYTYIKQLLVFKLYSTQRKVENEVL